MVKTCCVYRCNNQCSAASRGKGISFFRFPKDKRKRKAWVKAVNRRDWVPNEHTWICSDHFIDGWHGYEPEDENYAPTIFAYKGATHTPSQASRERRRVQREQSREAIMKEQAKQDMEDLSKKVSLIMHSSYCATQPEESDSLDNSSLPDYGDTEDTNISFSVDAGTQCDPDPLLIENQQLRKEVSDLREELKKHRWGADKISRSDSLTKFYTGLPTFAMFLWLFEYLSSKCSRMTYWTGESTTNTTDKSRNYRSSLTLIDQLLAVLMRNRLGLFVQDIADRFNISPATFSKYYATWICLMHTELKFLNPFPPRDIVKRTMPVQFKAKYPSTRIILDCTEIFIQRPSSLTNQSMTFSSYKHHTTIKFLVGVTPSGVISFVSDGWGGRVSDRQLTESSGVLDLLESGDSVMADKGFTIGDLLQKRGCTLNIPPFRGSSNQFSTEEVFHTQEIAQLRIHVERSIGRVKGFHIFDGILPLTLAPLASKIFQVCCWMTNFDVPLVEDK